MKWEGQEESDAMGCTSETSHLNPGTGLVQSGKRVCRGFWLLLELLGSTGGQGERLACLSSAKAQLGWCPHRLSLQRRAGKELLLSQRLARGKPTGRPLLLI